MATLTHREIEAKHTSGFYNKRDLTIVRGEGCRLYEADGREFLDMFAGIAVCALGHCPPTLVEAIQRQAETLISCSEVFHNDRRAEFLDELNAVTPESMDRFFVCGSGTEAVEGCLKIARLATKRTEFVCCNMAFHGRTFGALSATAKKDYREPFEPLVPGFKHVRQNDCEALAEAVTDQTAAILIEPIQGEGGIRLASDEFLQTARLLADERGCLLILDEIQCGTGRTGKWWGHEWAGVTPDLMSMAKGLGSGFPVGAIGIGRRVGELPKGAHGSTYGGNPLACAAGAAVLRTIREQGLLAHAAEVGEHFMQRLRAIDSPLIREVRGRGLIIGVELKKKVAPYLQAMFERHNILALNAGPTVIRFVPPLNIGKEDLDFVVDALADTLQA